jgi:hypothetical protein
LLLRLIDRPKNLPVAVAKLAEILPCLYTFYSAFESP